MNQELLDQLIGAPPPSRVDVDRIIVRQRRRRRLRRLAAGGGTAVVVVVAVVLGVSLAGGQSSQRLPVATLPSVAPAEPSRGAVPPRRVETDTEAGRQRTLAWLRTALKAAVAEHAPGTTFVHMPDMPGEEPTPDGEPKLWVSEDPVSFNGRSGLASRGGKAGFFLTLRPVACTVGVSCSSLHECDSTMTECTTVLSPRGEQMRVHWVERPGQDWVFYGVDVMLADRVHALRLVAVNHFGGDEAPVTTPLPLLTRTELDDVATEIAGQITG